LFKNLLIYIIYFCWYKIILAQRSGPLPASNRIFWRKDSMTDAGADNGVDLNGGCKYLVFSFINLINCYILLFYIIILINFFINDFYFLCLSLYIKKFYLFKFKF